MNDRPRCAFDTNVIVSALLFELSQPGRAFYAAIDHAELLLSDALFAELSEVLSRRKFDRYFTADQREQFLVELLQVATLLDVRESIRQCRIRMTTSS